MSAPQTPTSETGDISGNKSPPCSPDARELVNNYREGTVACGGDTLTASDEKPGQSLASVSRALAVTATVTESPENAAERAEIEDNQKIPRFLRRYGIGAAHGQPSAIPRAEADQPSGFVPSIVLRDRRNGSVTSPVTPPQAPPVAASVTAVVGSICPTCNCRVPARLSNAERQRAYRARRTLKGGHYPNTKGSEA